MKTRLMHVIRIIAMSVFITIGAFGVTSAGAQESTVPAVEDVADTASDTVDDSGFDDWGLLGLFGLAGLAGLLKKPTHEVRTVERVDHTRDPLR